MVTHETPQSSRSGLRRLVGQLLVGNLAYLASQFAMLVVLARWSSVDEVGTYAWSLAVAAPIFILANLRLQQLQAISGRFGFADFVTQRGLALAVAWLAVGAVVLLASPSQHQRTMLVAVASFRTVDSLVEVVHGQLIRYELAIQVSTVQIARAIGGLVAFTIPVILTGRATPAVWFLTLLTAVTLIASVAIVLRKDAGVLERPSWPSVLELTIAAVPLGVAFFVGALTVNVPRYIIEWRLGSAELAVFAAAAYVIVLSNTLVDTALTAVLPRLALLVKTRDWVAFTLVTHRLVMGAAVLGVTGVLVTATAGAPLLELLYGREYRSGATALVALAVAAGFQYLSSTWRNSVIGAGRTNITFLVSCTNAGVTVLTCLLLVGTQGVVGVASGFAVGQAVAAACYAAVFYRLVAVNRRADDRLEVDQ